MNRNISRALWCALFVGGLTVLGATAANAAETGGEDALASGNQVVNAITVPIALTGNAISVLGDSSSSGAPAAPAVVTGRSGEAVTDGQDGVASGNQVGPDATAPVAVTGNAISALGDSSSSGMPATPATAADGADQAATTDGQEGVVSGNQVAPDVTAPVAVTGNAISVLGDTSGEPATAAAPPAATVDDNSAQVTDRIRPISRMLAIGDDGSAQFQVAADVGLAAVTGDDGFSVVQAPASDQPAGVQPAGSDTASDADDAAVGASAVPAVVAASVAAASADPTGVVSAADLSTQALADTGADPGNRATAAALLLGAGLALTTVARRKSLRL